jgi:hypothetical protein
MSEIPLNVPPPAAVVPRRPRRRWVSVLLYLVLFASGIVIGSGVTLIITYKVVHYRLRHPEQFPDRAVARLKKPLDLSNQQAAEVRLIMRSHLVRLQALRRQWQPQLEAELDSLEKDVAAALKPEQAEKWHTIARERRQSWLPPRPPAPETQPGG